MKLSFPYMMLRKGFIKLLRRYREDTLPSHVKEAMDVWYHSLLKPPVEKDDSDTIRERIWLGISGGMEAKTETGETVKPVGFRMAWRVAVAVALFAAAYYFSQDGFSPAGRPSEMSGVEWQGWSEEKNTGQAARQIVLSDGSKLTLQPGSSVRFPRGFAAGSREIYLEGSGLFDVTKDPKRPFIVYAGAVVTRVLGTSFTIKPTAESGGTEVAVLSGKVTVEKRKSTGALTQGIESRVVLTPNKKVTFFEHSDLYVIGLVENPVIVPDKKEYREPGAFSFDETPLSDVLEKLESAYGVEINLSNDDMLTCPVTADLSSDNLYEKIEIIGAVLNARYEITGNTILLSGGGCDLRKSNPEN